MNNDIDKIWIHYDTNMAGEPFMHASIVENKSFRKYLRAEPVEALLKQARDVIAIYNDEYSGYDDLITDIDAALGEDK